MIAFKWVVNPEENGLLLREYLRVKHKISRRALADIKFKGGAISVNGKPVTVRYELCTDDIVQLTFPEEKVSEWIKPFSIPLTITFEDEHILVLNKPPFLPTIPSMGDGDTRSLAGAVLNYYGDIGLKSTFHAVNRLDKNTSGLLMIAKHRYVHDLFAKSLGVEGITRTYVAIVHGVMDRVEGTIDAPIGRKEGSIIEREVRDDGQRAVTHYKVMEKYDGASLVQLQLETGRTHQIRVHLSHLGFPIVGDTLYGGREEGICRQALHSAVLRFTHPFSGEHHVVETLLPDDMAGLREKLLY